MSDLIIDLDDAVLAALEARAGRNGVSVEEEARRILSDDVTVDPRPDDGR